MRRAVAGSSPPARQARAARDLERNDHQVAGSDGGNLTAGLHDLGNALMSEGVRAGERVAAAQHGDIEVTRRHRHGPHDRRRRIGQLRLIHLVPPDLGGTFEEELTHHRTIVIVRRSSCQGG